VLPMKNPSYGPREVEAYKSRFDELKENLPNTFTGFEYDFEHRWADLTPAQRREVLEECYNNGSLKLWLASFAEMFFDERVNEEISEFVGEWMRARLIAAKRIELPVPTGSGSGSARVLLATHYLDVSHPATVAPVGVRNNPTVEVVPEGILLQDGTLYGLDI